MKFSSLKNKKFQELNFQASKIKETHSGKFLVFQEMELFSLQVEKGFLQSLKNKKKYRIFFKLKRKRKKVSYTYPYKEGKFSKSRNFLIIII